MQGLSKREAAARTPGSGQATKGCRQCAAGEEVQSNLQTGGKGGRRWWGSGTALGTLVQKLELLPLELGWEEWHCPPSPEQQVQEATYQSVP